MVNSVTLIGRLGQDPEVRHLDNGNAVANFSLATSEKYKDKSGQKQEQTEWHNVVVWGKLAEVAEKYLSKGSLLYVSGKIRTRSWEDKEGNKRYTTEIIANTFQMLGGTEQATGQAKQEPNTPNEEVKQDNPDDLPF